MFEPHSNATHIKTTLEPHDYHPLLILKILFYFLY